MAATVLKLRYRVLGNTLARRPWQLVGFCLGILWALGALALLLTGLVALAVLGDPVLSRSITVLGGAVLILGWIVGPLFVAGIDTTVDAAKLAPFPVSLRQVMTILTATGLTGIPGIATSLAALMTLVVWVPWPAAAVAAVPCAALAVLTCVLATRLASALTSGIGGDRRGRELVGTLVLVLVLLAGPLLSAILAVLSDTRDLGTQLSRAAGILAWTPFGAAWAVPGDLATGAPVVGLLRLVIAIATPVLLWLGWRRALERATVSPPQRAARSVRSGALGLFGVMPTGGVGATWARSLTGWLRDPRYLRQLIIVPLMPIIFAFTTGTDGFFFTGSPVVVALVLCIVGYSDVSYDGTAFASVLSSGIRGRADRAGRLLGAASLGVPLVVLVTVVTSLLSGHADLLPAVLGGSLGLLLAGYGVTAVSSALIVTPVSAPGDSPFKTVPGQTFLSGLLVFVVMAACFVVALPSLVLSIVAMVRADAALGWIALAVGLLVGGAAIAAGILIGGRTIERTGPDLLLRIKAFPVG